MPALDNLIGLIAPHNCLGCGGLGSLLCGDCAKQLPSPVSRCYRCHRVTENGRTCTRCRRVSKLFSLNARTRYEGTAEALVQKLKYGNAASAADDIARELAPLLPRASELLITHLPTATSRVRTRGYDQAELIAKSLSRRSGLPYASLLLRLGQAHQVGAGREERIKQAADIYRARSTGRLAGASIVLVDDVITTGASLEAAAKALKAAGAKRIYGLVFCQA